MKTALITGSTDGIGKMTAIELAKEGYTIHLLGRNEKRGNEVLEQLKSINPKQNHIFYQVDLSTIKSNVDFLKAYTHEHQSLDVLILNALSIPNKTEVTEDGLELTFAVGYLSRFIFSILLETTLQKGVNARVIHIGEGYKARPIDFSAVQNITPSNLKTSLLQKLKLSHVAYTADGILTYQINKRSNTKTPHEYYHPGLVNTKQVNKGPAIIKAFGRLSGRMMEPQKSGKLISDHILQTNSKEVESKYYSMGKLKNTPKKMKESEVIFEELITFSERITDIRLN